MDDAINTIIEINRATIIAITIKITIGTMLIATMMKGLRLPTVPTVLDLKTIK